MPVSEGENSPDQEILFKRIKSLENRLGKLESLLRVEWKDETEKLKSSKKLGQGYTTAKAESKVVEYGIAWLGSIVFAFGIVFLMSYTENLGYLILSKVVAYLCTLLLFTSSYFLWKSFPILAKILNICSSLLIFYITVRLHFFTEQPLIQLKEVAILLLFILIGVQIYQAIQKKSEFMAAIAIVLCTTTAIISDSTYITFLILTITAVGSLILFHYKVWWRLHISSLFMVYLVHLLWLFNNPIMDHPMRIVELPQYSVLFLIGYAIIYSFSVFVPKEKLASDAALISISIWNALCFSSLLLLTIPSLYSENYILIFIVIAIFNLLFAVILNLKSTRSFAPATFSCFSFMAISIAVYGYAGFPEVYFLLALQSFLVVSMALWFRSKIVVVANSLLFIFLLLSYLISSESIDITNFTFAFIALATARFLNWQKELLTLKTDVYRNIYLIIAFFMILLGLNNALPSHYVTLAWTATAFGFFALSYLLQNRKYRYLSIATIIITGGHLFFVDLGQMEIGFRVIAFLVFAIISLGVSLYYTKRIRNKT